MKLQTGSPPEPTMRFFTPELYLRFNSEDDAVADLAHDAWEETLQAYRCHFDQIAPGMPPQARKLAELKLHDAEVLGFETIAESRGQGPLRSAATILSLRQEDAIVSLIYLLCGYVRESTAMGNWPFSKLRKHCLYDEIDVAPDRPETYLHRILFSDGSVVEIPFASAIASSVALPATDGAIARRIA